MSAGLALIQRLRWVLTIVQVGVDKSQYFQVCAMYHNKHFTKNMLHYPIAHKSIALYD